MFKMSVLVSGWSQENGLGLGLNLQLVNLPRTKFFFKSLGNLNNFLWLEDKPLAYVPSWRLLLV